MNLIKGFLTYTFLGTIPGQKSSDLQPLEQNNSGTDVVDEVVEIDKRTEIQHPSETKTRNKIIVIVNWVLTCGFLGSLIFMMYYAVYFPDKKIPDIFQNIVWATIGFFGSAFLNFVEQHKRTN